MKKEAVKVAVEIMTKARRLYAFGHALYEQFGDASGEAAKRDHENYLGITEAIRELQSQVGSEKPGGLSDHDV